MREIQTTTIHQNHGGPEHRTVRSARVRAESVIESDTIMVHTIMFADGETMVNTYRRDAGTVEWHIDSRMKLAATRPTRWQPRSDIPRPPASVCAADHFYKS